MFQTASLIISITSVLLVGSLWTSAEPTWTSLRVTWGLNLFSSRVFAKLPRTETEASKSGFTKLPGECAGGKFLGIRYIKGLDPAVVLHYDLKGYIAGIQTGLPKSEVEKINTTYPFATTAAYQLDTIAEEEVYFLTAYFVDPRIICNEGRTEDQFHDEGTGTGLYLQNGSDPIDHSLQVPLYEKDTESNKWVKGACFRTMGVHYWYDFRQDMDCNQFFPFIPIYNRGKLTNFAFASVGFYSFSTRFEHPPSSAFASFMPSPIPHCFYDEFEQSGGFSTMHVYFTVRPWNLFC